MDNPELLSAEDNLFGRVALYNKLVEPDQVAECTRMIFVETVAGLPRRTLGEIMVSQGYLSPQVAKSIAEAVRKKLAGDAEKPRSGEQGSGTGNQGPAKGDRETRAVSSAAPQSVGPSPSPIPNPRSPKTRPSRAKSGDSRVMVKIEAGAGPRGRRIWVETPAGGDTATVRVACAYLYPTDARDLATACRELLALNQPRLQLDLREVDYVPSTILGEIARVGIDAREGGRRITLLANKKVAAVAAMVVGKIVTVVGS